MESESRKSVRKIVLGWEGSQPILSKDIIKKCDKGIAVSTIHSTFSHMKYEGLIDFWTENNCKYIKLIDKDKADLKKKQLTEIINKAFNVEMPEVA